jgi:hypothetical protein
LFDRFYDEFPDANILAVYPEKRIREESINFNNKNLKTKVTKTASKDTNTYDVILIDELQYVTNPETLNNKVLKIPCKFKFGNGAILENNQKKELEKNGIDHCFYLDEFDAIELGIIPKFEIKNIKINLTFQEIQKYVKIQNELKEAVDFLYPVYKEKSLGMVFSLVDKKNKMLLKKTAESLCTDDFQITEGQLMGKLLKYIKLISERKELLKSAFNKFEALKKIVEINKLKKGIIFTHTQSVADKICKILGNSSIVYTSSTPEKNVKDFINGKFNQLIVVGKANVGNIDNSLEYAIHVSCESTIVRSKQKRGRTLGIDKNNQDKNSINYYLYIDDFFIGEDLIESQEKKWLKNNQKNSMFIDYLTLDELIVV